MDHCSTMAARKSRSPDTRATHLGAEDWVQAALEAMGESGVSGVAVETIARKLGVTKGSFYWHFTDREDLLKRALGKWEESYTDRVIAALDRISDPRDRLVQMLVGVSASRRSWRIHVALGAATGEPLVAAALARVTRRRLAYIEQCYAALGMPKEAARRRALVAYSAYVGLSHVRLEAPREAPTGDELAAYAGHLVAALVP
jgi:AcrR family transcriptional regulator